MTAPDLKPLYWPPISELWQHLFSLRSGATAVAAASPEHETLLQRYSRWLAQARVLLQKTAAARQLLCTMVSVHTVHRTVLGRSLHQSGGWSRRNSNRSSKRSGSARLAAAQRRVGAGPAVGCRQAARLWCRQSSCHSCAAASRKDAEHTAGTQVGGGAPMPVRTRAAQTSVPKRLQAVQAKEARCLQTADCLGDA